LKDILIQDGREPGKRDWRRIYLIDAINCTEAAPVMSLALPWEDVDRLIHRVGGKRRPSALWQHSLVIVWID